MTSDEIQEFLSKGTRTGKLATTRADGRPHVAPIWFILDGEDVIFMTGAETVKGRTLRRDPRAALVVDFEAPPYAFVMVDGRVTLSSDLDEMLPYSIEIARRYMGDELAEEYGRRNAVAGELLVRLHPERTVAVDDMAGS
jgi:PPOX class probable F420-dependent enzyme